MAGTECTQMVIRVPTAKGHRPWVEQVAGHIGDPIMRLRFLKAVAPTLTGPERGKRGQRNRWLAFLAAAAVMATLWWLHSPVRAAAPAVRHPPAAETRIPAGGIPDIWLVEQSGDAETYSNGLRIDSRFAVATHARAYLAFPARGGKPQRRTQPAGIVFHSTESPQAPFEASENGKLKRIGESLLEYVRRRRSYNFVVDRFGRVYRVVPENQAANHAGYSLWADGDWAYVNLNESFLGVSFEAQTSRPELSPAQVRSGAMLVEMLRSRYRIAAGNCVTHAQVSVNPANQRVGYHTDWAADFPFETAGLPDNYALPPPAIWQFGFNADDSFRAVAGDRLRAALNAAERRLAAQAQAAGLTPAAYRKSLRGNYRKLLAETRRTGTAGSEDPE